MSNRIHCIGDSHVCFFSGVTRSRLPWPNPSPDQIPFFKTYWLGALLAYNLINKKIFFDAISAIPKDEWILLVFGEIDCRAHLIKKSRELKKDVYKTAKECADRYITAIELVRKKGHKKIIIFCAIPSTRYEGSLDKIYPTIGTNMERNKATVLFNEELKTYAKRSQVQIIEIFDKLIFKDGSTNMKFYRDKIHLNQKIMPTVINELVDKKIVQPTFFKYKFLEILPIWMKLIIIRHWPFSK